MNESLKQRVEKWYQKKVKDNKLSELEAQAYFSKIRFVKWTFDDQRGQRSSATTPTDTRLPNIITSTATYQNATATSSTSSSSSSSKDDECIEHLSTANLIIEAVVEDVGVKKDVFKILGRYAMNAEMIASNTSSISITDLALCLQKERDLYVQKETYCGDKNNGIHQNEIEDQMGSPLVIGMHFMNPVPVIPLIEVVTCLYTSQEVIKKMVSFGRVLEKNIGWSKDRPGFVANRILMPYINEAVAVLGEGVSTREDIDTIMKIGTNVPMGPLRLADFIGLDTCVNIMNVLCKSLGEKYKPSKLLVEKVESGKMGQKTGEGFYKYNKKE